jgi:hypothetical protein
MDEKASTANVVDLLRRIHPDAWAEITEPNGWSYHTRIGGLVHWAADEIERLQSVRAPNIAWSRLMLLARNFRSRMMHRISGSR